MRGLLLLLATLGLLAACGQDQGKGTLSPGSEIAEQRTSHTPTLPSAGIGVPPEPESIGAGATLRPSASPGEKDATPGREATSQGETPTPTTFTDGAAPPMDTGGHLPGPTPTTEALNKAESPPSLTAPSSPISLKLATSRIERLTAGALVSLTATALSDGDADDVSVGLDLPDGLALVDGEAIWTGDLSDGVPLVLHYRVRASQPGNWGLVGSAKWYFTPDSWYGDSDSLCLSVGNDSVEAISGQCPGEALQTPGISELKTEP